MIKYEMEDIQLQEAENGIRFLKLPELTEAEEKMIDPIVAPTSGLRIQIYDKIDKDRYLLTRRKLFLFLRVFKAISLKFKEHKENKNLRILIFTDNRPSRAPLLKYCSEIFAFDGYEIYHQKDDPGESQTSSPYGAASIALYSNGEGLDIKLTIVLTASHNDLSWNGIKFYIEYPIPISGDLFKAISKKAVEINEIGFRPTHPIYIDAEGKNNEYILALLSEVLELKSIIGKNIIIWPYLGKAREIVNIYKQLGANVTLIEEEINPPNPTEIVREEKLKNLMASTNSNIAILLDADRDRIVLYVKQKDGYYIYNPNEIYAAMHNILAKDFDKKLINVRTIPSDLRGDKNSFINILTGVGYKHLGVILYFLFGIPVEKSKIDNAILYVEDENKNLIKFNSPNPLKERIINLMEKNMLQEQNFIMVMWEESGGHTLNVLNVSKYIAGNYKFKTNLPLIADKYPVSALILITELICRGYIISESIDWSIVGINRTIPASDKEKVKIMKNFKKNDNKIIKIGQKEYKVHALSDNNGFIDIYQLKSKDSTLYFRPSGTGPEVRFYVFGKRETHLEEIKRVQEFVKKNYS